jgi:RHS repeat-associated protein
MLSTDPGTPPEQTGSPQASGSPHASGSPQAPGRPSGESTSSVPGAAWPPADGGPPPPPSVSLPKGGGAIRDIGEKFTVGAATGTASLSIPVATSAGRGGFGPSLSLAYDSGAGNGPLGLGWKTSLPAITRKTDKGLPCYQDDPDQDTFLLSGAEDLVPFRAERDGVWVQASEQRTASGGRYEIQRYRPRIEGLFARIERWRHLPSGQTHWRSITSGNVTTIYGATAASRIADPADPARVYSWLICASYDDTGNAAVYDYLAEDSSGVDTALASESNRTRRSRSAGRYPKRIRYGNRLPWPAGDGADQAGRASSDDWMFEVVFDYGDHDGNVPRPEPSQSWPCRPDPLSTYRPGFEVRTYRRCQRILMFHHFPGEPGVGAGCLVSSTDLTYESAGGSGMTTLASVTHTGYRRHHGGYHSAALPPLELRYSRPSIGRAPRDVGPEALQNLPVGIDPAAYQWVDLDGEGLSGILARHGDAWFYKANLGGGRFAPQRMLPAQPATAPAGRRAQLLDLASDGHLDLAELGGPVPGFYERTEERGWLAFRPFRSQPNISWDDPDLRMVDLDGDGLADVLITGDDAFTWYPSLGYEGFGDSRRAYHPWDEETGPRLMFADPEQAVYLADMSGDGLSDLVRVRVGEICYWPNVGFGRFGAKVTMDRCPWLDEPDHFDQRRVRLADVDGSGNADLIYLHPGGTRLYLNQSGNGFADPHLVPQGFPRLDSLAQVTVTDLLGRGTACLVWSSPLPGDAGRQLRYIDLMTAGKPYLLTEVVNNLGAETRISYAPSTQFYLADQAAGRPWITRLPFPVQVVERVVTTDRINRSQFTTRHAYHHGYFDGFEREFRGFGMVEQWDTEDLAVLEASGAAGGLANLDPASDLPPVLTRTWLHTGVFPAAGQVTRQLACEYYRQPGGGDPDLPDTALPATLRLTGQPPRPWRLSRTEAREACRALKGLPLREEVYALDGSEAQGRPYAVTEHNYTIELLQPATEPRPAGPQNYHAVLLSHARETVCAHYERTLYPVAGELRADPRITHDLVLAIDDYGNPLRSASAGYGRRYPDRALAPENPDAQRRLRLTHTDSGYTNPVELPDARRTPLPSETTTFEIVGLLPQADGRFGFAELRDQLTAITAELPFQDWDADPARLPSAARRLIARTRVRYRRDDLSGPLPVGVLEPLALPYRSYREAFTSGLVADLLGDRADAGMLTAAGYLRDGEAWRLPSGRVFYSPDDGDDAAAELAYARRHFFLPRRFRDPFGHTTAVALDQYDLLVAQTRDPLGNLVTVGERDREGRLTVGGNDYRVLAPRLVSDANRNRAAVAFDLLARVCGTAEMGKPEERLGDSLDGFELDPDPATVAAYFADPFTAAHRLLGQATTRVLYDLDAYRRTRQESDPRPAGVVVLARETHVSDLAPGQRTRIQRAFSYSDGFGREIQHKGQAAAGPVTDGGPEVAHRWIGSGWTVLNNKGKPVRTYEPFFTATPEFEFARTVGVSAVLFYDPVGRVMARLHPDGSYDKTTFDPWHRSSWDAGDTVLLDPRADPDVAGYAGRYLAGLSAQPGGWATWYARRIGGALGPSEQRAAEQAALYAGTPTRAWLDTLGRTFLTVMHNRVPADGRRTDQYIPMLSRLDIQGNQHEVRDALGRAVMRYGYAMLGGQLTHAGMDVGGGALLPDVTGKPVRSWTSRGFAFRTEYDALRRPVRTYVAGPGIAGEVLQARNEYGESVADAEARNLRSRVARQYDGAGATTNEGYDFKGNLLGARRQLAAGYTGVVDWASDVPLEARAYPGRTSYDALNRPTSLTTPDGSVMLPVYNPSSLLDRLDGRLRGAAAATTFVARLDYNARGQRALISYGNGAATTYAYDPLTFRLVSMSTRRGHQHLQDLRYAYDPIGNPTLVRDHAQQRAFFRNRVVDPTATYRYDALYRLIEATGREHLGQAADGPPGLVPPGATDGSRLGLPQPGDGAAMTRYTERYGYDEVGNLLRMAHRSADDADGGWTRGYRYDEPSLLEPGLRSNRLSGSGPADAATGPQRFCYDEQGNTTAMPQIPVLRWDQNDRLHVTARQAAAGSAVPQSTYYAYDAGGQRVRKVTDRASTGGGVQARKSERIYLGTFEIYREYGADGAVTLERETLHVLDDKHRVALVETRAAGTDRGPGQLIRYQLASHLGSSVLELDQRAQVISYEEYYPYGSTSYQSVRARTETPKRYRFTGRERDTETGLYYHGARYYAPWLGRWTSCDPAGLADGVNLYAYVHGSPVTAVDPSGTAGVPPWLKEGSTFQKSVRNLLTSAGQRTHQAFQESGFVKSAKGLRGFIDHAMENRAIETKLMDVARKSYRAGGVASEGGLDHAAIAARARSWIKQLSKYGEYIEANKIESGSLKRLGQTVVVGIKGAKSTEEAKEVLATIRGALPAGVKAGGLMVSEAGELSTMTGKALGGAARLVAGSETAVAKTVGAAARAGEALAPVGRALAPVGRALAPVARVIGKVAAPLAVVAAVAQVATAHTAAQKADAAISVAGAGAAVVETVAAGMAAAAAAPVAVGAGIAGAAVVAGGYVGGKAADLAAEHGYGQAAQVAAGTLSGAATGAAIGAVVGSIVPGVGTVAGAVIGGIAGGAAGFVKSYWR